MLLCVLSGSLCLERFALLQATEYNCSLNCSLICHSRICSVCTVAYFLSDRTSGAINQLLRHFHYFTAMISDNAVNNLYITFSFLMLSHLVEFGIYPSANVNNLESIRFGIRPVRPSLYVFVQTMYFTFHVNQTMYASTCNGATFRKTDHNPQHVSATFCDSWHFLISRFPLVQISSMN